MKRNRQNKTISKITNRWMAEDYPGGTRRFQIDLLMKDIAIFFVLPLSAVVIVKLVDGSALPVRKIVDRKLLQPRSGGQEQASQIIHFQPVRISGATGEHSNSLRKAPGTLVRVRLLNTVETLSASPVHAQIIDGNLGNAFLGGTLIGEAIADPAVGRITISFHYARYVNRTDLAQPIVARALSLDGTAGVLANKKEGFFARGSLAAASSVNMNISSGENQGFKSLVARAVASGLMQEFKNESSTANNRAQVFTLMPMTEFFVELTDYFPSQH
jgi:hypothetical protein